MRCFHVSLLLSATFLATVSSAQNPLTILNNGFPIGAVGQSYAQALSASGGTQPYSWSATGQIPPGLVVNSVGTISGTPRTGGTYSFTLTVVDLRQATASKALSIVISGPGPAALTVTTTTLPAGAVGQSYSQTLTATGGTPPYRWSAGTGFPTFLTLDAASGTISGTPTASGVYIFPGCGDRLGESYGDRYGESRDQQSAAPYHHAVAHLWRYVGSALRPDVPGYRRESAVYLDDRLGRRGRLDSRSCHRRSAGNTANRRYFQLHDSGYRSVGHDCDPGVFAGRQPAHADHHHHFARCRRPR